MGRNVRRIVVTGALAGGLTLSLGVGPALAASESGTLGCPLNHTSYMNSRVSGDNTLAAPGGTTSPLYHNGGVLIERRRYNAAPGIGGNFHATTNDIMDHAKTYAGTKLTGT